MRRSGVVLAIAIVVALTSGISLSRAQDDSSKPAKAQKPPEAYHLDFALNELEDGKKINTRQYSLNVLAVPSGPRLPIGYDKDLKIGTKIPIETDQGKMEYIDIGTSIRCQIFVDESGLTTLDARADVTSLVPKGEKDQYIPASRNPMLRQLQIQSSGTVTLGKLTSLGTVDDPDSKRQFQLEVTVTKLR
jgi:hypothetical protein